MLYLLISIGLFFKITNLEYILINHFIKIKNFYFSGEAIFTYLMNPCALIPISFKNSTDATSIRIYMCQINVGYYLIMKLNPELFHVFRKIK